ncbi:hypothetical protein [Rhodococcus sp. SJ-2]
MTGGARCRSIDIVVPGGGGVYSVVGGEPIDQRQAASGCADVGSSTGNAPPAVIADEHDQPLAFTLQRRVHIDPTGPLA